MASQDKRRKGGTAQAQAVAVDAKQSQGGAVDLELVADIRYSNRLPDVPYDAKLLAQPMDLARLVAYKQPSNFERLYRHELLTDWDLGVNLDLVDIEAWEGGGVTALTHPAARGPTSAKAQAQTGQTYSPGNIASWTPQQIAQVVNRMPVEDRYLFPERSALQAVQLASATSTSTLIAAATSASAPGLRPSQSALSAAAALGISPSQAQAEAAFLDAIVARNGGAPLDGGLEGPAAKQASEAFDLSAHIQKISNSFDDVSDVDNLKHPTNPAATVEAVWEVLPDDDLRTNAYYALPLDPHAHADVLQLGKDSHFYLKAFRGHAATKDIVALLVPKTAGSQDEDLTSDTPVTEECSWQREFEYSIRNEVAPGSKTWLFVVQPGMGVVTYKDLVGRVSLTKRSASGAESEAEYRSANFIVTKKRPTTEDEALEPGAPVNDEDAMVD